LTTIINRNIGGFACELDSRMASIYAKQRPDDVAMVIVSINSNCESMERELVNGWLRDPIFTVLPGISFPSISGSN
ncbi:MAG: hypothetical protein NTV34_20170, partial [Proteobacteria bacterium]|nr:hypothetical protein [Pseudomonadota bacterium]